MEVEAEFSKLGSHNYAQWSAQMAAFLVLKDLYSAVCGTEGDVSDEQDRLGKAWLTLSVLPQHVGTVQRAKTAREAWTVLRDTYAAQCAARRLGLTRELYTLAKRPAERLTVYVGRATGLRDQLRAGGHDVSDQELTLYVLAGLPDEYRFIFSALGAQAELSLADLLPKLLLEEWHLTRGAAQAQRRREARAFHPGTARRPLLMRELATLAKLPSETLPEYVGRAAGLRDQLLAAGRDVSDQELTLYVLAGLSDEYRIIVTVLGVRPERNMADLLPTLLLEEARILRCAAKAQGAQEGRSSYSGGHPPRAAGQARPRRSLGVVCYYCNEPGHFKSECPKLRADVRAAQRGARSTDRSGGRSGGRTYAVGATASIWRGCL